jgi:hypothetical protein
MCLGMNDIYGWKCGWKMVDEFFHKHWQQKKIAKN